MGRKVQEGVEWPRLSRDAIQRPQGLQARLKAARSAPAHRSHPEARLGSARAAPAPELHPLLVRRRGTLAAGLDRSPSDHAPASAPAAGSLLLNRGPALFLIG
uniref:Uncharacterized protein n=1 Tax=Rangifer tarandus platyrhynchus TaxID=3082113 RepID=A0ACB0FB44_RANTA|nr:unnamed protein product [Rangifer tarandus platyrhynchus]